MRVSPKDLTKEEFGQRLYQRLISKGWNQSDLAKHAGISRDAVSTYVRGASFPSDDNLAKLATALGIPQNELLPNANSEVPPHDGSELEFKVCPTNPDLTYVRFKRLLPTDLALQIFHLIRESDKEQPKLSETDPPT